ncbi:neurogenic differentiation factor 1-like [Argopecten irradians]|uniref:neurogenic differentiation factor 1-like n=1 Tax=Argopecten irradians TaxID=31199 RepID=UPI003716450B
MEMEREIRNAERDIIENKNESFDKNDKDMSDESEDDEPIDLTLECDTVKEELNSDSQERTCFTGGRHTLRKALSSRQRCIMSEDAKRKMANIQERNRMQKMSSALQQLKDCLPDEYKLYNKKLSKIRTLRIAIGYIRALESMLKCTPTPPKCEQIPAGTPGVPGPNSAYLAALGTCAPLAYPTPGPMETMYPNPLRYTPYYQGSPYWIPEGLHYQTPRMLTLQSCCDTPNYPTPDETPGSSSSKYTPVYDKYPDHKSDIRSHRLSSVAKRLVRSSVYPSPFGDRRNNNELNTSFLSAGSEEMTEPEEGRERFSSDCCFAMEGVYPLPPDDATPDHCQTVGYSAQ